MVVITIDSCKNDDVTPVVPQSENTSFEVNNNTSSLNARVHSRNQQIPINATGAGRIDSEVTLTLIHEVDPPTITDESIMATSIFHDDELIAISYNTAGGDFGGGVVLMTLDDNDELQITSQITSGEYDVSHAVINESSLYATGSVSSGEMPAFVGKLDVTNNQLQNDTYSEVRIGGFVGTSLTPSTNGIYATSAESNADGGGVYKLSAADLSEMNHVDINDARWGVYSNALLYVQNGQPGGVTVYDNDVEVQNFTLKDASPSSRSSFDIMGDYLFLAAGQNGVQIHHTDGTFDSEIPLPDGVDLNTNSVAVYGDLIFISNGAGLYVATYSDGDDLQPEIVGQLELGDFESVNDIEFVDNKLIVASGLGGVKVIKQEIEVTPPVAGEILSNEGMSITYFDSQEPKRNRYADYLIDDDPNSFWHTEWVHADPVYPHEVQVDLGAVYDLTEFRYMSRQVGNFNGTVKDFELYISSDGVNWGTPFYTGSFTKTRDEQIVTFPTATGRYFRFLALSEVNGNPWASGSEINFVGVLSD